MRITDTKTNFRFTGAKGREVMYLRIPKEVAKHLMDFPIVFPAEWEFNEKGVHIDISCEKVD